MLRKSGSSGSTHASLRRQRAASLALLVGCAIALGACGSSPTASTSTSTSTTVRLSAKAAITANWIAFFSGQTNAATKTAVLQDGGKFAQIIKNQTNSAIAKSVHAVVSSVSAISSTSATVHYSLYLGKTVALANQVGQAVHQSGVWKVSDSSFCVLLGLEGVSSSACPKS